ncbi:MAG: gluconate 2-dehydrogenase subunit 3 family protein, partial [Longimicrobiales bacterium]
MSEMNRREAIQTITLATLAIACGDGTSLLERARRAAGDDDYEPDFFTPHEWRTVHVLADLVIPADDRSGSATDAGVPRFMDVVIQEFEDMATPMRGGLAWLDRECHDRHGMNFVECDVARQTGLLDL